MRILDIKGRSPAVTLINYKRPEPADAVIVSETLAARESGGKFHAGRCTHVADSPMIYATNCTEILMRMIRLKGRTGTRAAAPAAPGD